MKKFKLDKGFSAFIKAFIFYLLFVFVCYFGIGIANSLLSYSDWYKAIILALLLVLGLYLVSWLITIYLIIKIRKIFLTFAFMLIVTSVAYHFILPSLILWVVNVITVLITLAITVAVVNYKAWRRRVREIASNAEPPQKP